ncbi:MAG: four helix bundle protein [Candidatus Omnitrophica bacterium]|nr:four helix bundle protein [Candidatus Omnitrophota bacterium]
MEEDLEFDFERLEVYKLALEFLDFIFMVCKDIPRDLEYCLGDNLKRAGISISNNIAEGSGKKSGREKARYYGISLDSARECVNMFIILNRRQAVNKEDYLKARSYGKRLTSMLFKLIASTNNGKQ